MHLTACDNATGWKFPPGRIVLSVAAVMAAVAIDRQTGIFAAPEFTGLAVSAILVFGLPHGALDIALLRRAGLAGRGRIVIAITTYLAVAATTFALWTAAPMLALAGFLVIGIAHFAEDWTARLGHFFAIGIATALITGPALVHGETATELFEMLGAGTSAATLVDAMTLVAPVGVLVAGVGIFMLHRHGDQREAGATAISVLAMIFLTPLAGFVIYFCFLHSPKNYARARAELGLAGAAVARRDTVWLSLAALGMAVAIAMQMDGSTPDERWLHAGFVTLSVLTVPHMLAGAFAGLRAHR